MISGRQILDQQLKWTSPGCRKEFSDRPKIDFPILTFRDLGLGLESWTCHLVLTLYTTFVPGELHLRIESWSIVTDVTVLVCPWGQQRFNVTAWVLFSKQSNRRRCLKIGRDILLYWDVGDMLITASRGC